MPDGILPGFGGFLSAVRVRIHVTVFFTFGSVPDGILPGSGRFLSAVAVSIIDAPATVVLLLLLLLLLLLGAL